MVNITINEEKIQVADGTTVLEAAKKANIYIPTMCSDPDLKPYGACRLCLVEVGQNGRSKVTTSCTCPVEEGMVVKTDTEQVNENRRIMADLMLSSCPNVPSVKRIAASLGVEKPSYPTENEKEDCILCGMCVRACDEIAHENILGIVGRGQDRRVTTAFDKRYAVCDTCNKCIEYCPTGAITHLPAPKIGAKLKGISVQWKRARQVFQYAALALFLFFVYKTIQASMLQLGDQNFNNLFSRMNPLQAFASMLASKQIILNYFPVLLTIGVTLVFGRVWCGWFCPLGGVLEQYGRRGRKISWQFLRKWKYVILFTILVMAAFGSLSWMWFEPITIMMRGLTAIFKPLFTYIGLEKKADFVMPGFSFWAIGIPFLLVLLLNLVEKRFWCRYLCPLGALVGLGSKISWFKRFVNQKSCVKCGDCEKVCPMGAISDKLDFTSDPAECIMCMDCAVPCPKRAISFEKSKMLTWNNEFDPSRREALATIGLSAAAIGLLVTDVGKAKAAKSSVLRPPGAGADFDEKCCRCGQCIAVCPKHALVPAMFEAGWDSTYSPILDPFSGGCDYECNRCGQICPSRAIPALSLEEKHQAVIGIAQVNFDTCIRCMSCERDCPYGAFKKVEVEGFRGTYPEVITEKCVGCGICVEVCPKQDVLAVVVYPKDSVPEPKWKTTPTAS